MKGFLDDHWKTIVGIIICGVIVVQMVNRWNDDSEEQAQEGDTEQVQTAAEPSEEQADGAEEDTAEQIAAGKEDARKVAEQIPDITGGGIIEVGPMLGDDWTAVNAVVTNEWYLMSDEEKEYFVQELGPTISEAIVTTGATDYCEVHFVDENGATVASPKFSGGYELH